MNEERYQSWSRTISFLLKLVGVAGILFCPVFWALTGRIELAFLPFFGTLAGVGQGLDVLKEMAAGRAEAAPALDSGGDPPTQTEAAPADAPDVPARKPPATKRPPRSRRRPSNDG